MTIAKGKKFLYVARNSVFEIVDAPLYYGGTYLVYYPASGAYRRYTEKRILDECTVYAGPPDEKNIIALIHEGWVIEVDCARGTLSVNGATSKPGTLQRLINELKERGLY